MRVGIVHRFSLLFIRTSKPLCPKVKIGLTAPLDADTYEASFTHGLCKGLRGERGVMGHEQIPALKRWPVPIEYVQWRYWASWRSVYRFKQIAVRNVGGDDLNIRTSHKSMSTWLEHSVKLCQCKRNFMRVHVLQVVGRIYGIIALCSYFRHAPYVANNIWLDIWVNVQSDLLPLVSIVQAWNLVVILWPGANVKKIFHSIPYGFTWDDTGHLTLGSNKKNSKGCKLRIDPRKAPSSRKAQCPKEVSSPAPLWSPQAKSQSERVGCSRTRSVASRILLLMAKSERRSERMMEPRCT